jgi:hypothetical protein
MLYLIIGSRMNKCTRTLITAFTSQINGGKAMTPGLSSGRSIFDTSLRCGLRPVRNHTTKIGSC